MNPNIEQLDNTLHIRIRKRGYIIRTQKIHLKCAFAIRFSNDFPKLMNRFEKIFDTLRSPCGHIQMLTYDEEFKSTGRPWFFVVSRR